MALSEAADALADAIAPRAEEIEKARRLPADIAKSLADAGLLSMFVPKGLGGAQASAPEGLAAIERIAQADGSAGWCTMIAATTGLVSAYLPPDVAKTVYGRPGTITGGVFAPKGKAVVSDAHLEVTGQWQWASGSANCDWLMGGCVMIEKGEIRRLPNGAPDARMVLFPRKDVELIDTWHVSGLCGTGSGDMAVEGLRVPRERSVSLVVDPPRVEGALYAFPVFAMLAFGIAAVALGNARGAVDAFTEFGSGKKRQYASKALGATAHVQAELAKAEARLRGARAFFYGSLDEAWARVERGETVSVKDRALLRLAATDAVRASADVIRIVTDLAGGAAAFLSFPLQRRFRDAHVMTSHIMVAHSTYDLAGKVLFGMEVDPAFL